MASDHAQDIPKQVRASLAIFAALLVLTAVTVAASNVTVGVATGIIVALIIAIVKGSLVAGFFMHLLHEKRTVYSLLLVAGLFLVTMMGLMFWSFNSPLVGTGEAPIRPAVAQQQAPEVH